MPVLILSSKNVFSLSNIPPNLESLRVDTVNTEWDVSTRLSNLRVMNVAASTRKHLEYVFANFSLKVMALNPYGDRGWIWSNWTQKLPTTLQELSMSFNTTCIEEDVWKECKFLTKLTIR